MMVCGVKEGEEEQGHTEIEVTSGFLAGPYPKDYTRRPMPCHACAVQWGGAVSSFTILQGCCIASRYHLNGQGAE